MEIVSRLLSFHVYRNAFTESYPTNTYQSVNDFEKERQDDHQFVWYYATWCKFCSEMKSSWSQLENKGFVENNKKLIKIGGNNVSIKGVDCEKHPEFKEMFKIKGYPTIILHTKDRKDINYEDKREPDKMFNFLKNNISTTSE